MIISLTTLLVAGITGIVLVFYFNGQGEGSAQSINDMNDFGYETPEITTDLEDGSFVRIQFQVITDSRKAQKEVQKREFQIQNIIIKELAVMNEEDFKSGLTDLEKNLQESLNELMSDGEITDVYTTSKILQQ